MKNTDSRTRKTKRVRAKIKGTKKRPRLSVYRSNKDIYAQLIDDENQKTILAYSSKNLSKKKIGGVEKAGLVGEELAKKAKRKKITVVVFDRGRYKYHGRVKALAEGARKGGLKF